MKTAKLKDYIRGWFVGNFDPSLIKTENLEVAVKEYRKGEYDPLHFHKISTEITVVVTGSVKMKGKKYYKGDMIILEPDDISDLESLEDNTVTVVVKVPSANKDKYIL